MAANETVHQGRLTKGVKVSLETASVSVLLKQFKVKTDSRSNFLTEAQL